MRNWLFVMLVCTALLCAPSVGWSYDRYTWGGHEYALTSNYGTWQSAEAEAESLGGHLVTINSAAENAWLTQTFANTYYQGYQGNRDVDGSWDVATVYIGLHYDYQSYHWEWISGEPLTYTNPEPAFATFGDVIYLCVAPDFSSGMWNGCPWVRGSETRYLYGVMEFEGGGGAAAVPELPAPMLASLAGVVGLMLKRRK